MDRTFLGVSIIILALSVFFGWFGGRSESVFRTEFELPSDLLKQELDGVKFKDSKEILNYASYLGSSEPPADVSLNEDGETAKKIRGSVVRVQNRILFRFWIQKFGLQHKISEIETAGVQSLEDAYWFTEELANPVLGNDLRLWTKALENLPVSHSALETMKSDLWSELFLTAGARGWRYLHIIGGVLVVTVTSTMLFGGLLCLIPDRWRRKTRSRTNRGGWYSDFPLILTNDVRKALARIFRTGKTLAESADIDFGWEDPHPVGSTMQLVVKLYQKGKPYPVSDGDDVTAQVVHNGQTLEVATEVGGVEEALVNVVKVSFRAKKAGEYKIHVKVGSEVIRGSPFVRTFLPGPPDPLRSCIVQQMSTRVATVGKPSQIAFEPKDQFDNSCAISDLSLVDFELSIKKFGGNDGFEEPSPIVIPLPVEALRLVILRVTVLEEGIYRAILSFGGEVIRGGDFNLVVLTENESQSVNKFVSVKSSGAEFEAKLLAIGGQNCLKKKKIWASVSQKQMILREYFIGFIPKRIATFRVCPLTRFQFDSEDEELNLPLVTIDDSTQPKVTFLAKDVKIIAAAFTEYLMKNIGGSETFADKQNHFFSEMRKHHSKKSLDKVTLFVERSKLVESSMAATKGLNSPDWCRNFEIRFLNEEGLDWGGVRREWFELLCTHLFDAKGQLFTPFTSNPQGLAHPNPDRPSSLKLKHYEFAGRIVGKCLYESSLGPTTRQLVRARFTRSFLAQVIGLRVNFGFFEFDDPELFVSKVKYLLNSPVKDLDMNFTEEEFSPTGKLIRVVDLVPGGSRIKVTDENKIEYLNALAQYRLVTRVRQEVEAFSRGLRCLVPEHLLVNFDEKELELLLSGISDISVDDFKKNSVVNGNSPEFRRIISWFWTIVSNFTVEEMARLLQFTTGCSQLPPGGFAELMPRFQIAESMGYNCLPVAHTCFNQLCLPDYESFERMEKSLLLAIKEGSEGFLLA